MTTGANASRIRAALMARLTDLSPRRHTSKTCVIISFLSLVFCAAIVWVVFFLTHFSSSSSSSFNILLKLQPTPTQQGAATHSTAFQLVGDRIRGPIDYFPVASYVAACLVIKDQHHDLVEWIEYYRWLGVGKIYVYDHQSSPPLLKTVLPFVKEGVVEYIFFQSNNTSTPAGFFSTAQGEVYNDCLFRTSKKHTWMMFFDSDEFLLVTDPNKPDLASLLREYEQFGALGVNWQTLSGMPHVTRPKEGVLASYTKCFASDHITNKHVKVIVNLNFAPSYMANPHEVKFWDPSVVTVDELQRRVDGAFTETPTHTRLALYHYAVKSDEDFKEKLRRGSGDGLGKPSSFRIVVNRQANSTCMLGVEVSKACCPLTKARAATLAREAAAKNGSKVVNATANTLTASTRK